VAVLATVATGLAGGALKAQPAAAAAAAVPVQPYGWQLYGSGNDPYYGTAYYPGSNYYTVDFGAVQTGVSSTQTVVIQAKGIDTVATPAIATTSSQSPNSGDFSVVPDQAIGNATGGQCFPDTVPDDFQATLMDGTGTTGPEYCSLDVTFTPSGTAAEGAELPIRDTSGNLIGMFFLTGSGKSTNTSTSPYAGAISVTAGNAMSLGDLAYITSTCYGTFSGNGTITWGDATSEAPTYSLGPGEGFYHVDNSHTYATPGLYFLEDKGTDSQGGGCGNTYDYTHVVVVAPGGYAYTYTGNSPKTDTPLGGSGAEGSITPITLAYFSDTDPPDTVANFSVSVSWGDGTTSTWNQNSPANTGDLNLVPDGLSTAYNPQLAFLLTGYHTYAEGGTYTPTVHITDAWDAVVGVEGSTPATVTISDPAITAAAGPAITGSAGTPVSPTLMTFTDADTAEPASHYQATVSWGDMTMGHGTVVADPVTPGQFDVNATHTYTGACACTVSVALSDPGAPQPVTETVNATIKGAAPTVTLAGSNLDGAQTLSGVYSTGVSFSGTAAADPNATNDSLVSWTLDFGDGSAPQTGSDFSILSGVTHNYNYDPSKATNGVDTYQAVLSATDAVGSVGTSVPVTVTVSAPPSPIQATMVSTPQQGVAPLAVSLAVTVTDPNAGAQVTSWSLDFGDGSTPASGTGPLPAAITHTYQSWGSYIPILTVSDTAGVTTPGLTGPTVYVENGSGQSTNTGGTTSLTMPTSIALSDTPGTAAGSYVVTATVSPAVQSANAPTGTVTFYNGTTPATCSQAGDGTLNPATGTATCHISIGSGAQFITAAYSGDANFSSSFTNSSLTVGSTGSASPPSGTPPAATGTQAQESNGSIAVTFSPPTGTGASQVTTYAVVLAVTSTNGTTPTQPTGFPVVHTVLGSGPFTTTFGAGTNGDPAIDPTQTYSVVVNSLDANGDSSLPTPGSTALVLPASTGTTGGSGSGGTTGVPTAPVIPPVTSGAPTAGPAPAPPPAGSGGMVTAPVGSTTVSSTAPATLAGATGGGNASINVPAGALPQGTTVTIYSTNPTGVSAAAPSGSQLVASFGVSWQTPSGGTQDASAPITLTFTDPSIKAGDVVYEVGTPPVRLGTASSDGTVTFTFSNDPVFMVATPPPAPPVTRVAGADRDATAVAVSDADFAPQSAGAVVLARNDDYPDALTGGPLAAASGGPLLLTAPGSLDPSVAAELARVLPKGGPVYLLGGTSALSTSVEAAVDALGYHVVRLAGADRYATAAAVAAAVPGVTSVFEVTGSDFADAVSAVPAAVANHGVVLLTDGATQSAATAAWLAAHGGLTRYAVGGPAAQADPSATAVSGADRYATAAAVAARFFPAPKTVGVATGTAFPDALSAGARPGGPMLLVPGTGPVPSPVSAYLSGLAVPPSQLNVYGGTSAVSDATASAVDGLV
jgi:hypothetical protein